MTENATISELTQTPCPHCAAAQPDEARFCSDCGGELSTGLALVLPMPRESVDDVDATAVASPAPLPTAPLPVAELPVAPLPTVVLPTDVLPAVVPPRGHGIGGRAGQITAAALAVVFIAGVSFVAL